MPVAPGLATMSERLDGDARVDVVQYPSGEVKAVPAGRGADVVQSFEDRGQGTGRLRGILVGAIALVVLGYSVVVVRNVLLGLLAVLLVVGLGLGMPQFTRGDAELLDDDVSLHHAREQWAAEPEAALTGRAGRRERDHAVEGDL